MPVLFMICWLVISCVWLSFRGLWSMNSCPLTTRPINWIPKSASKVANLRTCGGEFSISNLNPLLLYMMSPSIWQLLFYHTSNWPLLLFLAFFIHTVPCALTGFVSFHHSIAKHHSDVLANLLSLTGSILLFLMETDGWQLTQRTWQQS